MSEPVQDSSTAVLRALPDSLALLNARGGVVQVAERIQSAFEAPMEFGGHQLYVRVSVGISISPYGGRDAETLLQHADIAMYRAKHWKLGAVVYAAEMNLGAFERLQLKALLNRAVENRELVLHYQLTDETVVGVEALVRWHHPQLGTVSPVDFIPLAEETGLIVPVGTWVLQEACRQAVAWQQAGLSPVRMALNVSALQFDRTDFVPQVARILQESGLEPALLELELTERVVMGDLDETTRKMKALKRLGGDPLDGRLRHRLLEPVLPVDVLKTVRSSSRSTRPGRRTPSSRPSWTWPPGWAS